MLKINDLVKINPEWLSEKDDADALYIVTRNEDAFGVCKITALDGNGKDIEIVKADMVSKITPDELSAINADPKLQKKYISMQRSEDGQPMNEDAAPVAPAAPAAPADGGAGGDVVPEGAGYAHLNPNMNVGGMGAIKLPTATDYNDIEGRGSGDIPLGRGVSAAAKKGKKKKKKNILGFDEFVGFYTQVPAAIDVDDK